jgi:hypothetical protein
MATTLYSAVGSRIGARLIIFLSFTRWYTLYSGVFLGVSTPNSGVLAPNSGVASLIPCVAAGIYLVAVLLV